MSCLTIRVVTTNPAARLGRIFKRKKDRRAGIAPLDREEVHHLLNTVNEKLPHVYPLILCAVRTGLRQGELIGLQWGDVDFHGGVCGGGRGGVFGPKNTPQYHKRLGGGLFLFSASVASGGTVGRPGQGRYCLAHD